MIGATVLPGVHLILPTDRLVWEWNSPFLPEILRRVAASWAALRFDTWGEESVVTCIWRTRSERVSLRSSWVHTDWRGFDGRVRRHPDDPDLPDPIEVEIRDHLNREYPTGVRNMPRVAPLRHGTAPHAHIQATLAEGAAWVKESEL